MLVDQREGSDPIVRLVNLDLVRVIEFQDGINLRFDNSYALRVHERSSPELLATLFDLALNKEAANRVKDRLFRIPLARFGLDETGL